MAKGYALTIGLNSVDPSHYAGWSGPLNACEADAESMTDLARGRGLQVSTLLTKSATRSAVLGQLDKLAAKCMAEDLVLLTYSGHGGRIDDLNDDEPDHVDETWCLYDGQLVDDEIFMALSKFPEGARVLVFSDSCHSGTVVRIAPPSAMGGAAGLPFSEEAPARIRAMPLDVAGQTYRANRSQYDPILQDLQLRRAEENVRASVLLISGCQDNQYSLDGVANGLFTGTLLRVWRGGRFEGDYPTFHGRIVARMPSTQTPNYFWAGQPDLGFERQQVFSI